MTLSKLDFRLAAQWSRAQKREVVAQPDNGEQKPAPPAEFLEHLCQGLQGCCNTGLVRSDTVCHVW